MLIYKLGPMIVSGTRLADPLSAYKPEWAIASHGLVGGEHQPGEGEDLGRIGHRAAVLGLVEQRGQGLIINR